jgi:Fe-S cluster biogenesis protein NfuA
MIRSILNSSSSLYLKRVAVQQQSRHFSQQQYKVGVHHFTHQVNKNRFIQQSTKHIQCRSIFLQTMDTPNPASQKFYTGETILDTEKTNGVTTMNFSSPLAAYNSPLAKAIFKVDGVRGVFLGKDFITVTIDIDQYEWSDMTSSIFNAIHNFYESGRPIVILDAQPNQDTLPQEEDDEVIIAIKEILETRIRPMVQEDGGDVVFIKLEDGVVYLQLQGSCTSCPSSTATLKHGIENMLMHYVPEVEEVRQYQSEADTESETQFKKVEEKIAATNAGQS